MPRATPPSLAGALLVAVMVLLTGCSWAGGAADEAPALRLTVPAGAVDEPVVPGGLARDGTLSPGRGELLWYTGHGRVAPGRLGTAVVAGHVSYEGGPDVFSALDRVGVGDEIRLLDGDLVTVWSVTEVEVVPKVDLQHDPRVWGDQRQTRRLVLITCDDELGFRADGHRAANLVVVAEPAGT